MLWHLVAVLCGGGIVGIALWLAAKNGSKSAQLEALKAEIKKQAEEQRRAQQITDNVYALSADDARRRLHEIANKQQR
jgi:hypothetical protein